MQASQVDDVDDSASLLLLLLLLLIMMMMMHNDKMWHSATSMPCNKQHYCVWPSHLPIRILCTENVNDRSVMDSVTVVKNRRSCDETAVWSLLADAVVHQFLVATINSLGICHKSSYLLTYLLRIQRIAQLFAQFCA